MLTSSSSRGSPPLVGCCRRPSPLSPPSFVSSVFSTAAVAHSCELCVGFMLSPVFRCRIPGAAGGSGPPVAGSALLHAAAARALLPCDFASRRPERTQACCYRSVAPIGALIRRPDWRRICWTSLRPALPRSGVRLPPLLL